MLSLSAKETSLKIVGRSKMTTNFCLYNCSFQRKLEFKASVTGRETGAARKTKHVVLNEENKREVSQVFYLR